MGVEIFIILLVAFSFVIAFGFPAYFIFKKLYTRPLGKVEGYNTRQKQVKHFFSPKETGEALRLFEAYWNETIEKQDIKTILDKLNIYWTEDPIDLGQTYVINNKKFSMASGLTKSKKDIEVWIFDKAKEIKISNTALVHELIHIVLWNTTGEPDPDHEDNFYKGWSKKHTELEKNVNLALKERGM